MVSIASVLVIGNRQGSRVHVSRNIYTNECLFIKMKWAAIVNILSVKCVCVRVCMHTVRPFQRSAVLDGGDYQRKYCDNIHQMLIPLAGFPSTTLYSTESVVMLGCLPGPEVKKLALQGEGIEVIVHIVHIYQEC